MTDWIKPFFVTSVYRSDLLRVSLTQEQAAAFTDEDMLTIAQIMQVQHLEGGVYTHLLAAVEQVLQKKEEQKPSHSSQRRYEPNSHRFTRKNTSKTQWSL